MKKNMKKKNIKKNMNKKKEESECSGLLGSYVLEYRVEDNGFI